jgi:hypothetical protein
VDGASIQFAAIDDLHYARVKPMRLLICLSGYSPLRLIVFMHKFKKSAYRTMERTRRPKRMEGQTGR